MGVVMKKNNFNKKITFAANYFWTSIKEGSKSNSYFNYDNYLKKYPDVKESGMNPFKHYLLHGIDEERSTNFDENINSYSLVENSDLFDYEYYCEKNNLKFDSYSKALMHYLEIGYKKGYNPSIKFNAEEYYEVRPDVKRADVNPLVHYLKYGKIEVTSMTENLNLKEYQLVKNSNLFDYNYYMEKNHLDLRNETEAIYHYLEIGYKKGYNPSNKFNGEIYFKKNPDIEESGWNPLVHYLKYGQKEERTDKCDKNLKEYSLVKESGLFDYQFYKDKYDLDLNSYKRGLIHYLEFGYKRGYKPSRNFDGEEYLKRYPEVKKAGFNPLVHYLKYGVNEERIGLRRISFKNFNKNYDVEAILENIDNDVTILLNVEDSNNLKECIENIKSTTKDYKIILIHENLDDEDLEYIKSNKDIELLRRSPHESFINALNNILDNTKNDIIFLKNNIRTFEKWIFKLTVAAYSDDRIGFVSPISNYSTVSLINIEEDEKSSEFISNISKRDYEESPLPNDSCVFIKKDVFKELKFDESSNEENWFATFIDRGLEKGWKSILDDSTYVYYQFNEVEPQQADEYDYSTPYVLENRPSVKFINSDAFNNSFQNIHEYADDNLEENIQEKTRKNILFAMHYGGGVEFTVKDIVNAIKNDYECYVLRAFKNKMKLYKVFNDYFISIKEFNIKYPWTPKMIHSDEYKQIYFYILINYNIDILEIDHLLLHTFDLQELAKKLDIPIILTLHDFYYICPSYFLLDENNKYCGGYCGDQPRNCSTRVTWIDLPANIVEWKNQWQEYMKELFGMCDYILTATDFTKDMFLEHYDSLKSDDITIIEHGRDLIRYDNNYTVPNIYQPIKILIPGVIGPHKGLDFIKELKGFDDDNRLEYHFIGQVDDELKSMGIYHGPYEREDFAKWVFKIKPSFIGIFSVCAETYSHTLTESICSGVPVLASNLGALKTRIESQGGGWLVNIDDAEETYEQILDISSKKEEYKFVTENLKDIRISSSEEMGSKYKEIYDKLTKKEDK